MANIKFIEKEQDRQNEATRYWFDVDGEEFAAVEAGSVTIIIDKDGHDLSDTDANRAFRLLQDLVVTDEMRAE